MTDKVWMDSNMEGSCWEYGIYPVLQPKSVLKKQKVSVDVIITHEGKKLSLVLSEERVSTFVQSKNFVPVPGKQKPSSLRHKRPISIHLS